MFIPIDYENWDRKEIYDAFHGYMYCMTVELDITEFLEKIHESHWKFYPSMCYCIAKTVNEHQDYRYAKINGHVGYFGQVNPHYTLLQPPLHPPVDRLQRRLCRLPQTIPGRQSPRRSRRYLVLPKRRRSE